MGSVIQKSILKALKEVGVLAGSAAVVAALSLLTDPAALAAPFSVLGPIAPTVIIAVNFVARIGLDAFQHRDKA